MKSNTTKALVFAAIAGLASAGTMVSNVAKASDAKGMCNENNSCKGNGTCAGKSDADKAAHTCKGQNACANNVRQLTKAECDKIKGATFAAADHKKAK